MWETWVQSLDWDDPLEKGKATHSSILAWRISRTVVHGVIESWTQLSGLKKKKMVSNRLVTKLDTCNNKRKYRVFNLQKFTEVRKHNCNTVCFAILEIGRIMMESIK